VSQPNSFLRGLRALDLTDLKGQLCGRLLADLGMEVIKVEPPGGDPVRRLPPFLDLPDGSRLSATFAHLNANKKSVLLDIRTGEGRAAFLGLAEGADLVLESFEPGFLESIDLGYERLASVNPGVVLASITGFGRSGPHAAFAAHDIVACAMGGLMYVSGDPELPPCKPPETQAYYFGSLFAAVGALAALYRRQRRGHGDHLEVSMQEALATQEHLIRLYANEGQVVKRQGSQHGQVAPARIFRCKNGYVYLYVTRQHWKLFLSTWPDHPEKFDGPEWTNNLYRRSRADEINREVEKFTANYTKEELTEYLQSKGIPCVPVNRPREFMADEQVKARGFMVPVRYRGGAVAQPAAPVLIDGKRPEVRPAPEIGEHQRELGARRERRSGASGADGGSPPLQGMRIVSFDHVLAGPYGMTVLAELGAEVIKVESSRGGLDPFRFFGTGEDPNLSPRFLEFNRNKRSVTINLKHPDGPRLVKELARRADAVVDNFSVRVMPAVGLGYEDLVQVKPDIVQMRMPGLGCTGPRRSFATVGTNITAFTGFTYLWNHPGKLDPPTGSQTVLPDYVSGVLGAALVIAAVLGRESSGAGAFIDLAQAEAAAFLIGANLIAAAAGADPEPLGNRSLFAAPHGCYRCRGEDRWCVVSVESDEEWRALARAIGRADLADEERFATSGARKANEEELDAIIEEWTRTREAHEVMELLQKEGVACGVVQTGADLTADRHLRARGFIVEHRNARVGRVVLPGFPLRFARSRLSPNWEFPELGRDNEKVFGELLGYSPEKLAQLAQEGLLV
jgi:crotonobetainyl-CoA:carnitine CoA-transferase CaiB-like acyl-CoA transferase